MALAIAGQRMHKDHSIARHIQMGSGSHHAKRRMRLQTLREAQAIYMCARWHGHGRSMGRLSAEWCMLGMESASGRGPGQKGLKHKRIKGEGRKALPHPNRYSCPCLAHGETEPRKSPAVKSGAHLQRALLGGVCA